MFVMWPTKDFTNGLLERSSDSVSVTNICFRKISTKLKWILLRFLRIIKISSNVGNRWLTNYSRTGFSLWCVHLWVSFQIRFPKMLLSINHPLKIPNKLSRREVLYLFYSQGVMVFTNLSQISTPKKLRSLGSNKLSEYPFKKIVAIECEAFMQWVKDIIKESDLKSLSTSLQLFPCMTYDQSPGKYMSLIHAKYSVSVHLLFVSKTAHEC